MKLPFLSLLLFCASAIAQDHGHLNVGSSGPKLTWDNGADFAPASSYIKTLAFTNAAKYAGFYQGNITLTALHARDPFGGLDPAAPRPGAFVVAEIVSVQGPSGGAFAFWENDSTPGNPTVSIPSGVTNPGFRFPLSQEALGAGQPDGDPFGHIHGRRLTATLPGIYTIGFRAWDTSTNGPNGGPIHTPSEVQLIQFQAGVVLLPPDLAEGGASVTLGAPAGFNWQLQAAASLPAAQWDDVGAPIPGNDTLSRIDIPEPLRAAHFFRAVGTPVVP